MKYLTKIVFFVLSVGFLQHSSGFTEEWKRVYLATYPRSGNHWVRYMLEEATSLVTSSVYPDQSEGYSHSRTVLPWGGYSCENGYDGNRLYPEEEDIIIIKTHYPALNLNKFDLQPNRKVIRIIRHPVDSIYSFYYYLHKQNLPSISVPREYMQTFIQSWKTFQEYWDAQPNVATFFYEDLCKDTHKVFSQIIEATGYQVTPEDITRAVNKYPSEGVYLKHLDHFHPDDLWHIAYQLGPLMTKYGYTIPNYTNGTPP